MMSVTEILDRWTARAQEWKRLHVQVDGATLASEVLEDLRAIAEPRAEETLTLKQASVECGFSTRQLARLIATNRLKNHGRKNAPRVLRKDLPRKAAAEIHSGDAAPSNTTFLQIARGNLASRSQRRGGAG